MFTMMPLFLFAFSSEFFRRSFRVILLMSLAAFPLPMRTYGRPHNEVQDQLDLAGKWSVQLMPEDALSQAEQQVANRLEIELPGDLHDAGLGMPVGPKTSWIADSRPELLKRPEYSIYQAKDNFKSPFWLQPDRHFVGTAEYTRTIEISVEWKGKSIKLELERPHWRTTVLVGGTLIDGMISPSEQQTLELSRSIPQAFASKGECTPYRETAKLCLP